MEQKGGGTNIKVAIRIRPFLPAEKKHNVQPQWGTQNNVIYNSENVSEIYSFDHIFGMEKTNLEIYNDIVKDFVSSTLDGVNSTIFAYGQTSSGKTYTMLGDKSNPGIMSLAIENIFKTIENNNFRKFLIRVSYIEIYNEKINDLLDPNSKDIKIRVFQPATIGLQNVKEELVASRDQMHECLKIGNLNRHIGMTKANDRSSRSHTIFRITIESQQVVDFNSSCGSVQISYLNLVDLAGSERVAQTKATGMRLKEGGHINRSLSALGLVIKQLSDGQEFVNFRDSKLTRLLQDSLGGNSNTLIIATITLASLEDTGSTLAFAQRAKTVKNKPQMNEILTDIDVSKRYAVLNNRLQKKLEEQMLINQRLQKTQEENNREMIRLQQQMDLLEDFQSGKQCMSEFNNIPRRRHTFGFSAQKQLPPRISFNGLEKGNPSFNNRTSLEHAFVREPSTPSDSLATIEEESTPPKSAFTELQNQLQFTRTFSTPNELLRLRYSALEQDYDELVTFTRDEEGIYKKTAEKADELERQLEDEQQKLIFFEDKFNIREKELCKKIHELEEELQKQPAAAVDAVEFRNIMDQLICLQNLLKNPSFIDDCKRSKQDESVMNIIEKFNAKFKTSKVIIENEILRQINNFDDGLQEQINLPNELVSFNDLLNELFLFESDIPVDLINNMKNESVEEFKVLIKIYESLLKKNELIKKCSEKIRILEEQKKIIDTGDTCPDEVEPTITITNLESHSLKSNLEDQGNYNISRVERTDDEKLQEQNPSVMSEAEKFQNDIRCLQTEIRKLTSNIEQKNSLITQLENVISKSTLQSELLHQDILMEKESLKREIEILKVQTHSKEELSSDMKHLKAKVDELVSERDEKISCISELENMNKKLKHKVQILQQESFSILLESESLKREIEVLKSDTQKNETLSSEIAQKNKTIREMQNNTSKLMLEVESLKQEINGLVSLNEHLRIKDEQTTCLQTEVNKIRCEKEQLENINTKLKHDVEIVQQDCFSFATQNESLKREIEFLKTDIGAKEKLSSENAQKDETIHNLETSNSKLMTEMDNLTNKINILQTELESERQQSKLLSSELEIVNEKLKHEVETLDARLDFENKHGDKVHDLQNSNTKLAVDVQNLKQQITRLETELKHKDTVISNLKNRGFMLKQESETIRTQFSQLSVENESLKVEIRNLKNRNVKTEIDELKATIVKLQQADALHKQKYQRQKCLLGSAFTKVDELKKSQDEMHCELGKCKLQCLTTQKQLEEQVKINEQLQVQSAELQGKIVTVCDNCSKLRSIKSLLCNIIEHCIAEHKVLLGIRHSQDERDYFKSILRSIKSNNILLKNHLEKLYEEKDSDLEEICGILQKCRDTINEYFSSEKSMLHKEIDQLGATNKSYLQEIIMLKEMESIYKSRENQKCTQCDTSKTEISRLKKQMMVQEQTLASLKSKNTELNKEKHEKIMQFNDLQNRFYEEQRKTKDAVIQQVQIEKLEQQLEKYKTDTVRINKQSVETQCDILQQKYNDLKSLCRLRKKDIETLKYELNKYQSSLAYNGQGKENKENCVSAPVQCEIISAEGYSAIKRVCRFRKERIATLETQIAALKARPT